MGDASKMVDAVLDAVDVPLRKFHERLKALEAENAERKAEIAELKARGHQGVWNSQKEYRPGAYVTHDGSQWHANATVKGVRPGTSAFWTLAVKRGKDGKDAR